MFTSFHRGWEMSKASFALLRQHPKLIVLPLISGVSLLVILGLIIASLASGIDIGAEVTPTLIDDALSGDSAALWFYAAIYGVLLVNTFITIFFNAALIFCVLEMLAGREPSLKRGLAQAISRLPQIAAWALVASTVGIILEILQNALRDRLGIFGALLGGVFELTWAVITYFAVPVIVVDGVGPIEAVKRSAAILRRTWGEATVNSGSLGLIGFIAMLPAIAFAVIWAMSLDVSNGAVAWLPLGFAIAYLMVVGLILTTLGTIFRTAAYVYAETGKVPATMSRESLEAAFRKRKK